MTRIVAGTARGRRLAVPARGTRPTTDRVREAMFSAVDSALAAEGRSWPDVVVLDLFAGSGALGLEAASRGAAEVLFVERSRPALTVLASNIAAVGARAVRVLARDVRGLSQSSPPAVASVVFADPPYEWRADGVAEALAALADRGWIDPAAIVVVERPARDGADPLPATWQRTARRTYGETELWYGRPTSDSSAGPDEGT